MSKRRGGLAVLDAAQVVRAHGRAGDNHLVHVNDDELQQMHDLWGESSYNEYTGLPEYGFMSKLKKAVKNIGKSIKKASRPWTINKQDIEDIKHGKGLAATGTPLHGLTAGYKIHELMSPTVHINDRIHNIRKNGFNKDHLKWAVKDQNHNLQDAVKENIIPIVTALTAGAGAAFGAGSGAAGAGGAGVGGAGAGAGAAGLGAAVPAGIETVTVTGAAGGMSLADIAAAASAVGSAGASAANATNAPAQSTPNNPAVPETVTVQGSRLPPGVTLDDVGALAAAAASANSGAPGNVDMGMNPATGEPAPNDSILGNIWDYIKNPDNWDQVIQGIGTVGSLYQQYAGGGGDQPAPPPGNPGAPHNYQLRSRQFSQPDVDFNYGAGPEASFYSYGELEPVGLRRGGRVQRRGGLSHL